MYSYTSHITPYLMAVAEGTLVGGLLQPNYASKWAQLFENHMLRYDVNNISAEWQGDKSADMAASPQLWHNMVEFLKCSSYEPAKNQLGKVRGALGADLENLLGSNDEFATKFANESFAQDGPEEARAWGEQQAAEQGAKNQSIKSAVGMMAVCIWRFKCRCQLHVAMLSPKDESASVLSQSLGTLLRLSTSVQKISEVFDVATWPARMALHDLLDRAPNDDPLKHLSSKARNRILLQCEGFGGFQVKTDDTVTEVTTFHNGDSGVFVRDCSDDAENIEQIAKYSELLATELNADYHGNLLFGAGKELGERKVLGWVTRANKSTAKFSRVTSKSFLDRLAVGPTSISKIILYLNWYIGGLSSWYQSTEGDNYGTLMREDATKDVLVPTSNALKMDTHFRVGDIIACSKLGKDGSIQDLVHHTFDHRQEDVFIFNRRGGSALVVLSGFTAKDCQFQALDTVVHKPCVPAGIIGDLASWVDEKYGQK